MTESFLPILTPASCVQVAPGAGAQQCAMGLAGGEWVADTMVRAQVDQN